MRALTTRSLLAALLLVLAGAFVAPASAAAPTKTGSSPEDGAELHQAPDEVSITFDQPLDPDSYIQVTNHCDERVDEQPTEVNGTEMSVAVTGNFAGMYHVTYFSKGLGGLTGQETGTFTFSVHAGDSCDGNGGGHQHGGGGGHNGGNHGAGNHGSGNAGSGHGEHGAGAHEGAAHRGTTHAGTHSTMSGTDHGTMDHGTMDHSDMDHSGHGSGGDHSAHSSSSPPSDATRNITSGPVSGTRGPGRDAALFSLGLCALIGLMGGAVLRFSAPN